MEHYSAIQRNELLMHTTIRTDLKSIMLNEKTRSYTLYDSTDILYLEMAKLYKWKTNQQLSGVRDWVAGECAMTTKEQHEGNQIFFDYCGGYTNLYM